MINQFRGDHAFLSNFYPSPLRYKGEPFLNSEAAYQAQKAVHAKDRKDFYNLSGRDAKRLGRDVEMRDDWEKVKIQFMREILREKFTQSEELKAKLLATGDEPLEEGNTWGDMFWGKVNGVGGNWLGRLLMELRGNLKKGP